MQRFRDFAFDWIAWAIFAAIPAVIFWQSATSLAEQDAASGGPMENAALYPRIVASIMAVLAAALALRLVLGRVQQRSPLEARAGTRPALVATGVFTIYLIVLPYAGFHLATPVLCFLLFWLLGIGPVAALAGGIGLSLATAFVFEGLLNVVLPVGAFNIALFS
ncbi:tripartite tricarboxylate transporter TctB family protein [Chelativorans salis]|uniref:Tripartite tricarboxylate transporter TctB family protein n=1 Tax=Chelativorans salis TaxID=2978478 RepID=A0ABT2LUF4_9HYPH|nr:tripartite tricarboxylate transporter TctB family protein [Chelativorans sp. EGI FJ00035]MCT7378156.1 tripartite tricarboxylate transporter TctB family protein [Chelativorans sp. EGI FJ00035]